MWVGAVGGGGGGGVRGGGAGGVLWAWVMVQTLDQVLI